MTLGELLVEIEDTVARKMADEATEIIAVLSAVIRARSSGGNCIRDIAPHDSR